MYVDKLVQNYKEDQRRIAYHEASHCVVALALQRKFAFVSIEPDGDLNGRVEGVTAVGDSDQAVQNILICYAGRVGESILYNDEREPEDWTGDCQTIDRMLAYVYGSRAAEHKLFYRALTERRLKALWAMVEKIAAALLQKKKLTYEEIITLLR